MKKKSCDEKNNALWGYQIKLSNCYDVTWLRATKAAMRDDDNVSYTEE